MAAVSPGASLAASAPIAKNPAPPPVPDRELGQALSKAVTQLNETGFAGEGREVTISLDPGTRQPVVKVIDINSGEVLHQWPSQYVLQLAEDSKRDKS